MEVRLQYYSKLWLVFLIKKIFMSMEENKNLNPKKHEGACTIKLIVDYKQWLAI